MLVLVPLALGLVIGAAAGGKIGNLADLKFRWPWFVLAVLVIREAVLLTPLNQVDGVQYVYAAALAALVAWTALHVKRLPGVWIVTLGAAMNLIVIIANGARMPVAPALATTLLHRGHLGQYMLMGSGTNLNWLADWIGFPWPVRGAYSPGDLVIALGIGIVVLLATVHRPEARTKLDETSSRIGR
ncbi:MAG: hypothetical protein E6I73_07315 [Chloroflexi bacterium]|nr:MAG: hypothetical protein E6I73_07315 [Chloroflexota bacterium]